MKITTGDFAAAIRPYYGHNRDDVRGWCESGDLPAIRSPKSSLKQPHWHISREGVERFLRHHLALNDHQIREVTYRLGIPFQQLALALTAA